MNQYNGLQRRYRLLLTMRSISLLVLTLVIVSSSLAVLFTATATPAMAAKPAIAKPAVASSQAGSLLWRYLTGSSISSSATVVNGVVYIGSGDSYVYALDASTGSLLWRYQTGNYKSSPTVVNGMLYIGSDDGNVYALKVGPGIILGPASQSVYFGSSAALTATVTDSGGNPLSGIQVTFAVLNGPDIGVSGQGTTDSSGQAQFSFTGLISSGTDTVQADFIDQGSEYLSNKTFVTFKASSIDDAIGELTLRDPATGNIKSCTATVVESHNLSVVLTAAHCVYGTLDKSPPHYYTDFYFAPDFSGDINHCPQKCTTPLGIWKASQVFISGYFKTNPDPSQGYDYAFLVMKPDSLGVTIGNEVGGGLPITFFPKYDQGWTAYGYPGTPDVVSCYDNSSEKENTYPGPNRMKIKCDMQEGASGGPWLNDNNGFSPGIGSVNSQTVSCRICTRYMIGTYLGKDAWFTFLVAKKVKP